ncbi:MAG: hypothetical protein HY303_14165, partial [Candidatus Wallbacteria bacterium]|nr:hypothetical protein [Candidatus Wallbacteria bacterium]
MNHRTLAQVFTSRLVLPMVALAMLVAAGPAEAFDGDLFCSSVVPSPTNVQAGQPLSVAVTVQNTGSSPVSVQVNVYLSTDPIITSSDLFLGSMPNVGVPPGGASNLSPTFTVPTGISGQFYAGALVDPSNLIPETNENNNATPSTGPITVTSGAAGGPRPDLVAENVHGPSSASAGSSITVSGSIRNTAPSSGADPSDADFVISTDITITLADGLLARVPISPLAPSQFQNVARTVTLPGGLAPGNYFIGLIADSTSRVQESNENNNSQVAFSSLNITGGTTGGGPLPDLIAENLAVPATATLGGQIIVSGSIRNMAPSSGAAASVAQFFLSADHVLDAGDTPIGGEPVPPLSPGAFVSLNNRSYAIPTLMTAGNYFLLLVADGGHAVTEADELNNVASSTTSVNITSGGGTSKPDLVSENVSGPSSATAGGNIAVSGSVRNLSTTTSAPGC